VLKYFNLTFKQTKCHSFYFGAKIQKRKRRTKVEVKIKIRTKFASCATPFRKTPVAVKFRWPEKVKVNGILSPDFRRNSCFRGGMGIADK
jgi:hypothetical protein